MQLYRADIWHDDAIALAVELSRDLHQLYNNAPGLTPADCSCNPKPPGDDDVLTVVEMAGAQDMSYALDDEDLLGYTRIRLRVKMDMRCDERKVKVGVNWPMPTDASPEDAIKFAAVVTRVACVAVAVEARIKRFFKELRPDPISEEKRSQQSERAQRRNILKDNVRHVASRQLAERVLHQYAKMPGSACQDEVEMTFNPAERRKLKECTAVVNVRHRRGKPSLVNPTDLGLDYMRQHRADNEAQR